MAEFQIHRDSIRETHTLDLDFPECNPYYLVPIRANEITVLPEMQLVDKITLYLPVPDYRDFIDGKYSAELKRDGTGVIIKMPTFVAFWAKEVKTVHALDETEACAKTETIHKQTANDVLSNPNRQTKKVLFEFPEGMTCSNDFFNYHKNQKQNGYNGLKVNFRQCDAVVGQDEEGKLIHDFNYIFWKVSINGPSRFCKLPEDEDPFEKAAAEAIKRMSKVKIRGNRR